MASLTGADKHHSCFVQAEHFKQTAGSPSLLLFPVLQHIVGQGREMDQESLVDLHGYNFVLQL